MTDWTVLGCDYSKDRPDLHQLWDLGYRYLGLYLWPYTEATLTKGKGASPAYVAKARAIGYSILPLYEGYANAALGGAPAAKGALTQALQLADSWGMPAGTPIVGVNVDFNADVAELTGPVRDFARVWHDKLGDAAWGYGGYRTLRYLFDQGVIGDALHAYAWGYYQDSDGVTRQHWDPRASFRQQRNAQDVAGGSIDVGHATPAGMAKIWTGDDMDQATFTTYLLGALGDPAVRNALGAAAWGTDGPNADAPAGTVGPRVQMPAGQPDSPESGGTNLYVRPEWALGAIAQVVQDKLNDGKPIYPGTDKAKHTV